MEHITKYITNIPTSWEVKRVKDLFTLKGGGADKKTNEGEELVKLINFVDVFNKIPLNNQQNYMIVSCPKYKIKDISVKKNDILITPSSETSEEIGLANIVLEDLDNSVFSYHILRLRARFPNIDFKFAYYYCNSKFAGIQFENKATGTTRVTLSRHDITSNVILVPSKEQQTKIANYLDQETSKIDRKISILEQKYEKLEEYKQSVIFETVTKGLDNNVEMKDSGIDWIGDIPKHWEVLRLKSIYNYKNGYAFSDNDYSKEPNGNYLIKITNVTENGIQEDETFCIEVNETTKKFKIKEDSILYALSGATAGKCCFLDTTEKNFYLNQRVAQMQLKNGINKYFYYLICNKVFANLLLTLYPQTAQPNIGKNDLDNSYVPFVSNLIEQKEIVEYLDQFTSKIDKKKEIIKKQIELLNEYKDRKSVV